MQARAVSAQKRHQAVPLLPPAAQYWEPGPAIMIKVFGQMVGVQISILEEPS